MNRRRFTCLLALIGGALVIAPVASAQTTYSFLPLAMAPNVIMARTLTKAVGLSPEGTIAVGEHLNQAAVESGRNVLSLGALPGVSYSQATGVAANGDAVTGWTDLGSFYWTPAAGMIALGSLPGYQYSRANDISENGDAVVGYCTNPGSYGSYEAFLWSPISGMQSLGFLPGHTLSFGTAVSGSGLVATGYSTGPGMLATAFRWESGQLQSLGTLPGYTQSSSLGISRHGDYIVGHVTGPGVPSLAFLWNKSSGMKGIAPFPGLSDTYLRDVSESGERSVGLGSFKGSSTAILYNNQSNQTVILQDLLFSKGITSVRGWQLEEATAISDDGTTIVGFGRNARGKQLYWQVTLP
jgi:uncharacterized membrane protein